MKLAPNSCLLSFVSAVLAIAMVGSAFAQTVPRIITVNTPPPSTAFVQAEGEAIARGFEEAYRLMSHEQVYITYSRADKGFTILTDIRQVRAVGGVLLITTQRGLQIAIPAQAVITITTERPTP